MAGDDPRQAQLSVAASESVQAFANLVSAISQCRTVQRIALSSEGLYVNLWVVLREESLTDMDRIFQLEYEAHRRTDALLLKVHVVPLDRVDEPSVPVATTLFERESTQGRELVPA